MISAGRTDAEVLEFMVQRYGDFVLYRPPVRDSTWPLWFGPFLLLALAVVTAVRYSRGRGGGTAAPLSGGEQERVRALLATGAGGRAMIGFVLLALGLLVLPLLPVLQALRRRDHAVDPARQRLEAYRARLGEIDITSAGFCQASRSGSSKTLDHFSASSKRR